MSDGKHEVDREVRLISLSIEEVPPGWVATLRVEFRSGRGKKRELLKLVDRSHHYVRYPIDSRELLDELLAEVVLQRRLPGID